ncbi:MAG: IPT/TIG domain-containing protein, partial [Opitutaceae bacterium]|nr:IPT/TIG domain-containing protein [Opitutaceae bacterium]
ETNRGPVGARISVLGRGFTAQDTVTFDGNSARTVYDSPNSISFFVPALDTGRNYKVEIAGANGTNAVGTFRIDPSSLSVSPSELVLTRGQTESLTFTLPAPAPTGGLLLDITTDAPDSVIMPEVVVEAGSTTATVTVTGGKPGSGSLFLKGFGTGEITVPVSVK